MTKFVEQSTGGVSATGTTFRTRLIAEGQGSSGFYTSEVLSRDIAKALPKGTQVFFDHMSESEADSGRARSIDNLVGVFESDPTFDATEGASYANIRFLKNTPRGINADAFIREAMDSIGVSIEVHAGLRDDDGKIVELASHPLNSLAVVTKPGARGKIVSLAESFRTIPATEDHAGPDTKDVRMDEKDIAAIAAATSAPVLVALEALTKALTPVVEDPKDKAPTATEVAEAVIAGGLSEMGRKAVYTQIAAGVDVAEAITAQKALEDSIRESLKTDEDEDGKPGFRAQESGNGSNKDNYADKFDALFAGKGEK